MYFFYISEIYIYDNLWYILVFINFVFFGILLGKNIGICIFFELLKWIKCILIYVNYKLLI